MSQEKVEIVRRAIEYFGETGEVDVECYDPEIEFTTRSDGPGQTTYRGIEGLRQSVESFREAWASTTFEVEDFIEPDEAPQPRRRTANPPSGQTAQPQPPPHRPRRSRGALHDPGDQLRGGRRAACGEGEEGGS
jgi:hypothetical protein